VQMAEAIIRDNKRVVPCCAFLEGEYGVNGYYLGVPCKLGAGGLEAIIELDLTVHEAAGLKKSMQAVAELVERVDGFGLY